MHNRQDGGDGILGEQLLPSENDDNKAKGVAEIFQQKPPGSSLRWTWNMPLATSEAPIESPAAIADQRSAMASRSSSFSPSSANHFMRSHRL